MASARKSPHPGGPCTSARRRVTQHAIVLRIRGRARAQVLLNGQFCVRFADFRAVEYVRLIGIGFNTSAIWLLCYELSGVKLGWI